MQQTQWETIESGLLQPIQLLEEQLRLANLKRFGKSTEKDPDQRELFDEAEQLAESPSEIVGSPEPSSKMDAAPKAKPGRKPLPQHLPRVVQEHDLDDAEKTCDCGCQKTYIGDQISEQLDIVPAKLQVIQHRRKKYACQLGT